MMIGVALGLGESLSIASFIKGAFFTVPPGVFAGFPFVASACVIWAILDDSHLHFGSFAALIGLAAGAALASMVLQVNDQWAPAIRDGAYPVCLVTGLLTGLGAWWIAYGRQNRLPGWSRTSHPALSHSNQAWRPHAADRLRTRRRTNRGRVILAILFAFLFPSLSLGMPPAALALHLGHDIAGLAVPLYAMLLGFTVGMPFVLAASAAWAIIDQFGFHFRISAALVGGATGIVPGYLASRFGEPPNGSMALLASLGVVTGLGVWWIAYGRQDRLPRPIVTRPQLNLDA
jgi:hypothetical protein